MTTAINNLAVDANDPSQSDELRWPTAHVDTGDLLVSMIQAGDQTDGTANPKIIFGYNSQANGSLTNTNIPYGASFNIEGHWDSDAAGTYFMEAYVEFNDSSDTYQAIRPFMATYNLTTQEINLCKLTVGESGSIAFNYHDTGVSTGNTFLNVNRDGFTHTARTSGNIITFTADDGNVILRLAPNGTSAANFPYFKMVSAPLGGSEQHTYTTLIFCDGTGAAAQKELTGRIIYRAAEGTDSVTVQIGSTGAGTTDALFEADSANSATTMATISGVAVASQTGALLRMDGITAAGAKEADKWQLFPKGSVSVKPTGGAVTAPTAGSGGPTALPTVADKPGTAIGSATATWFPMLDANGALFWVPGWSA